MKWFQHDSNASNDAKIRKLILKQGALGYAVYFHCLELISGDITKSNISFILEHDIEIITDNLKIKGDKERSMSGVSLVEEIMRDIISLGLFEDDNGQIKCSKLAYRLDNTVSRNIEFNKIKKINRKNINSTKTKRSKYVDPTKDLRITDVSEEKRREENKKDKKIIKESISEKVSGAWSEWVKYRIEIKKKLTPSTTKQQIKFLSQYEEKTQISIIETSIKNGWQGLFEPKNFKNNIKNKNREVFGNPHKGLQSPHEGFETPIEDIKF